MATVAARALTKTFGAATVLHAVDLDVADGEFVVLVGPSGCGKSTLLRMIAGLAAVTSGDIEMDGKRINDVAPRDRDIAMVFQNYALYPTKTVRQNMAFSLRIRREPRAVIARKVDAAAQMLGLEDLLDRLPGQLSGGQRQRVAMGRAIVREPKLFLFDEPLSNLDAKLRGQMRSEIKALRQRIGTTAIYVTHAQVEAMTLADRIVVMNSGRVEQIGAPMALYQTPANTFVARFIGAPQMNMLEGRVAHVGAARVVETAVGPLPLDTEARIEPGRRVRYGIRPEHLSIGSNAGMEATVRLVEPMGADCLIIAERDGVALHVLMRDESLAPPVSGETIRVRPLPARSYVFDAETGVNLALRDGAAGGGAGPVGEAG